MQRPIAIFDGHNDVLLRLLRHGGDAARTFFDGGGEGHLDLPRARTGGFAGGMFACFVPSPRSGDSGEKLPIAAPSPADARRATDAMLAIAMRMEAAAPDDIQICTDVAAIQRSIAANRLAMVLHLEGAEAIDTDLDALEIYYRAGVRSLGIVWSRTNQFGTGVPFRFQATPDFGPGLSDAGKALVRACNRLGILIDLSHLNLAGFRDVAALSDAPLVATHSCVHGLAPTARNLCDDQLRAIRESGGVVGLNFSVSDLRPDGRSDPDTSFEIMLRHLDHLLSHLGDEGVALGSDFDGAVIPRNINDVAGLPGLVEAMRHHGFDETTLRRICSENWLSLLERTWKSRPTL